MVPAVVCEKPQKMSMQSMLVPVPRRGEVRLGIRRVGVCGTDLHAFNGNQPFFEYPRVLGHELAAEVLECGPDVSAVDEGSHVTVIPYLHCGRCRACQAGLTNCCQSLSVLGVHRDGGMVEELVVPATHVIPSARLDLDQLALVECLAIGAHAVRRANPSNKARAVVVGAGPIGLGIIQILQARGMDVAVIDAKPQRLEFCRRVLGLDQTHDIADGDAQDWLGSLTGGDLADVVFDATGNPGAMEDGFSLAGHGGRYVLVSIVKADIRFHDPDFHRRELTLLGSRNATLEDFKWVMALMAAGSLHETAMITHRALLGEVPAQMATWASPDAAAIKTMVTIG